MEALKTRVIETYNRKEAVSAIRDFIKKHDLQLLEIKTRFVSSMKQIRFETKCKNGAMLWLYIDDRRRVLGYDKPTYTIPTFSEYNLGRKVA